LDKFDANKDYYVILGASEDSSPREIERLYKRLAHKHHPDRGGAEDRMKALNEAYGALRDEARRREYDSQRRQALSQHAHIDVIPTARDVGVSGQLLSALLCIVLGLLLLFLVRFNGLWFLWPLGILATGVVLFGVLIAHSAMTNLRDALRESHPARRFRAAQEIIFWSAVCGGGYGVYLIMTAI
jgi:curved DNA-binding protein CbpA